jgi:pimeloyl-ACP methyl ester carboxylesterase
MQRMGAARLAVLCLLAAGCASKPVRVRPIDEEERYRRDHASALTSDELSERTTAFLHRNLIDAEDVPALHARLLERRERVVAFHLAEISYARAGRSRDPAEAAKCFLSAAAYAYAFLFEEQLEPPSSPYDPIFLWSCEIYDRSLARVVSHVAEHGGREESSLRLPALHGEMDLERGRTELSWQPGSYERVLVAAGLEVKGLATHARAHGLGVPVIAVRRPPGFAERTAADRFLPPVLLAQAATVLARFGALPPFGGVQQATVEILDPTRTTAVRIGQSDVPLDADLTTPVAYMLEHAPSYSGLAAMMDADEHEYHAQLVMLQPCEPDRIPVVFVHGLMSSPMTWTPLLNEMLADPVLRARCQFWFFRYPTGYPVVYSGALLREALVTVARTYDPEGRNPNFRRMVLCGHSMGGLLSRLQVQTSGGRAWNVLCETPIDDLPLEPNAKDLLRRSFEFERLPFVTRIVFMAVPHRGSDYAEGFLGWLGASMIDEPRRIDVLPGTIRPLLREPYRDLSVDEIRQELTGIGNLSPENPVQRDIATWPYPAGVTLHSIIGNEDAAEPGGTDGIVAYWSSHVDGVASEKVVRSGHGVHWNMEAIEEVRRILRLHVAEVPEEPAAPTRP